MNQGTLMIDDPLSDEEADVSVGGITFGGGLRLRF